MDKYGFLLKFSSHNKLTENLVWVATSHNSKALFRPSQRSWRKRCVLIEVMFSFTTILFSFTNTESMIKSNKYLPAAYIVSLRVYEISIAMCCHL